MHQINRSLCSFHNCNAGSHAMLAKLQLVPEDAKGVEFKWVDGPVGNQAGTVGVALEHSIAGWGAVAQWP